MMNCLLRCYVAAQCRHAELERRARERANALEIIKEAHAADVHEEKMRTSQLQMQLESLRLELEKNQKSHTNELEFREQQIQE